jgi:hypothetical protein
MFRKLVLPLADDTATNASCAPRFDIPRQHQSRAVAQARADCVSSELSSSRFELGNEHTLSSRGEPAPSFRGCQLQGKINVLNGPMIGRVNK